MIKFFFASFSLTENGFLSRIYGNGGLTAVIGLRVCSQTGCEYPLARKAVCNAYRRCAVRTFKGKHR